MKKIILWCRKHSVKLCVAACFVFTATGWILHSGFGVFNGSPTVFNSIFMAVLVVASTFSFMLLAGAAILAGVWVFRKIRGRLK